MANPWIVRSGPQARPGDGQISDNARMLRCRTVWTALAGAVAAVGAAFAGAASAATGAADWMGAKGATAERVREPVFDASFMLYRAGTRGGEPVVLVHGLGPNGAKDWRNVVPALVANKYDVFAVDLPGFGMSDKGNELYSPENYAKFLEASVAPRVGRPFTLVGHSMGAAVSLGYAAQHPERVKRLVLADMAGILQGPVYAESLAKNEIGARMPQAAPWLDSLLGQVIGRMENMQLDKDMVLRTPAMRAKILRGDPNLIAAFALGEHDFSTALRDVKAPTLLVWGAQDTVAPLRTAQLARAVIPGARLELIAGAGHSPMYDDPDRFNELLLGHLAGAASAALALPERPAAIGGKPQKCDGQKGARFSGDMPSLTLIDCANAEIHNARIGELRVLQSDVRLFNTEVREGLYALRSSVQMTAGSVSGAPALKLTESEVDAAGTRIDGGTVNEGRLPVMLRLSVAEVRGKGRMRYVHDSVRLDAGETW